MEVCDTLVIGGGPAGLMAAEELARAGRRVVIAEARPSLGRKFLMAGKSGLNLTRDEPLPAFTAAYAEAADWLAPMLAAFGPPQVQAWARDLGQQVFTGSTGRVFPVAMKASPLLRAWAGRLAALGVGPRLRWRWQGWDGDALAFATPEGPRRLRPAATVLALGGASWARLGSDGAWAPRLAARGVALAPFRPANMGFRVGWSTHMAPHFGTPLKGVALCAGAHRSRGEVVVTARGLEGGGLYAVARTLRDGPPSSSTSPRTSTRTRSPPASRPGPPGKAPPTGCARRCSSPPPSAPSCSSWPAPCPATRPDWPRQSRRSRSRSPARCRSTRRSPPPGASAARRWTTG